MPIDASSDGNPGLDPASTKVSPDDVDVPSASKVDDDLLDDDLESAGTGAGTVDLDLGGIDKGVEADDAAADAGPKSGLDFDDLDDAGTGAKVDPSADLDDDPLGKDLGSALDDLDDDLGADDLDKADLDLDGGDIGDIGKADLDFDDPTDTSVKGLAGVDLHDDDVDDDLDGGFEPKDDDLFDS